MYCISPNTYDIIGTMPVLYGKTLHNLRFAVAVKGREWGREGSREAGKAARENGRQLQLEKREGGGSPVFFRFKNLQLGL